MVFVLESGSGVLVLGEGEEVVADAANLDVTNLDGGMEDAHLDADTDGVACLLVEQAASLLDALDTLLGLERDVVAFLGILDAVGIVFGHELELGGIFVALVGMGVVDGDTVLLSL